MNYLLRRFSHRSQGRLEDDWTTSTLTQLVSLENACRTEIALKNIKQYQVKMSTSTSSVPEHLQIVSAEESEALDENVKHIPTQTRYQQFCKKICRNIWRGQLVHVKSWCWQVPVDIKLFRNLKLLHGLS